MTEVEANQILAAEEEVVPVAQADIGTLKKVRAGCLERDIPATIMNDEGKLVLVVRDQDVPQYQALLHERFAAVVAQETGAEFKPLVEAEGDGDPACPGCGTVAPLVAGACSDCGLQLE